MANIGVAFPVSLLCSTEALRLNLTAAKKKQWRSDSGRYYANAESVGASIGALSGWASLISVSPVRLAQESRLDPEESKSNGN
jgi:hypothetical protein